MTDAIPTPPPATPRDLRNFALTFGVVAGIVAAVLLWRGRLQGGQGFATASVLFFVVGFAAPGLLRPAYGPWMKFSEILGYVNTRILLGLFYYVGVTPIGLMMRISGKDPMGRSFKRKGQGSYWHTPTAHVDGSRHFDRQF